MPTTPHKTARKRTAASGNTDERAPRAPGLVTLAARPSASSRKESLLWMSLSAWKRTASRLGFPSTLRFALAAEATVCADWMMTMNFRQTKRTVSTAESRHSIALEVLRGRLAAMHDASTTEETVHNWRTMFGRFSTRLRRILCMFLPPRKDITRTTGKVNRQIPKNGGCQ